MLTDEQLAALAQLAADTVENEIDCDEMLARAAAFVEAVRDDPDQLPLALHAEGRFATRGQCHRRRRGNQARRTGLGAGPGLYQPVVGG